MKDKQKTAELIRIAGPAVLESVVTVVITTIDTKMISGLGKPAISAVALTTQPKLIIFAIFFALGTTASILVAQAYFSHISGRFHSHQCCTARYRQDQDHSHIQHSDGCDGYNL